METKLIAATRKQAARLAGIRPERVDYWVRTQIVTPSIDTTAGGRRRVQLFRFHELMSLLVASRLRSRGISLQHVREIVQRLQERGYASPLAQFTFATEGHHLYFQDEHGVWESGHLAGQALISDSIDLASLRASVAGALARPRDAGGKVERRRGVMGSKRVFMGTRVPLETVRRYLAAGKTEDDVLAAFPSLTPGDVEIARQIAS